MFGNAGIRKEGKHWGASFDNFDKPDYPLFAPHTMLTRGFISLSFLNSTSAYLGTWPISEKMREQCDLCEDTFLSASFLNYHMSKQHKESCELGQCKDTFYQANFAIPCHHQQKSSRLNQQINLLQELLDPSW